MHDSDWIFQIQSGNVAAFRTLFEAYATRLRHFAAIWVPSDVAEDLVQDVLFDLWRRRQQIQLHRGTLDSYLFSAVRNKTVTYKRRRGVSERLMQNGDSISLSAMGMPPAGPDEQLAIDEVQQALAAAMQQLTDLQRAVLLLRWTQGMAYPDIAAALAISENAARHHLSRARQALRPVMEQYLGGID